MALRVRILKSNCGSRSMSVGARVRGQESCQACDSHSSSHELMNVHTATEMRYGLFTQ